MRRDGGSRAFQRCATGVLLALPCTGCFTVATADVRVRDPAGVSLAGRDGAALLEAGSTDDDAVVARGTYPVVFDRTPYVVTATRASDRSIVLHCDGCEDAEFPLGASLSSMTLLDAAHISNLEQSHAFTDAVVGFLTQK